MVEPFRANLVVGRWNGAGWRKAIGFKYDAMVNWWQPVNLAVLVSIHSCHEDRAEEPLMSDCSAVAAASW